MTNIETAAGDAETRRLKKNAAQAAYRARKKADAEAPPAKPAKKAEREARKADAEASRVEIAKVKAERKAAAKKAKPARKAPERKAKAAAGESRKDLVLRLLMRAKGATVAEIMEPTGWLPHTTRSFISAMLGKKLGHKIESEKIEGRGRVYRIAA